MSSFTAPLLVTQEGRQWRTARALTYHAGYEESAETYTVPAGFPTDFASIPRLLWPLIGHPAGVFAQAGVLHDWLYYWGGTTRARADALFLEAMAVLSVRATLRWTLYLGVRLGGWVAWRAHRRRPLPVTPPGAQAPNDKQRQPAPEKGKPYPRHRRRKGHHHPHQTPRDP